MSALRPDRHLRSRGVALWFGAIASVACDDGGRSGEDAHDDTAVETAGEVDEVAIDTDEAVIDTDEVAGPPAPATLEERGFEEVRLIAHLHSAFSHDGCDEAGLDDEGRPNQACVARMRRALCSERIGHAFMTDHPSHARDQDWEALFYVDPPADDVVLRAEDGTPWAVRFACEAGQGGPDGRVTLMVGFEGTHTMPLGLRRAFDWSRYHAFEDAASPESLTAVSDAVRDAGGHLAIAHSEQSDLSAATIAEHGVAAMEIYNFHANFNEVLGAGLGEALFTLEHFLDPAATVPDPDLSALILLGHYPVAALDKWRMVTAQRAITGFGGADAHENVSFAPACKDTDACDGLARLYPNLVAYLKVGGPVWQSDGERLDGYARVFRWVQNRVLVERERAADPQAVEQAFVAGRVMVVFEVLGDARGAALVAVDRDGALHDLGAAVPLGVGLTLWARSPEPPVAPPFLAWSDGAAALIESIVWRTDADGVHEVARWTGPSTWQAIDVREPGAYQLEVLLTPHHLADELGPASDLANAAYRWVESNAIRVTP